MVRVKPRYSCCLEQDQFSLNVEIKRYHYNEQYGLWTLVLKDSNVLFIYNKNIVKLSIIMDTMDYDYDVRALVINGFVKSYKEFDEGIYYEYCV